MIRAQKLYVSHFLEPQFNSVGKGTTFECARNIEVFGPSINVGRYVHIIGSPGKRTSLVVWPLKEETAGITIGDYTVIGPSVRISAALDIDIGRNCLIGTNAYITDCDWHDTVNRAWSGEPRPIKLEDNVWIGDSAIICKGVTVGKNSVVGAGSVVRTSIPADSVAVGNPAQVVRELDPETEYVTREHSLGPRPEDLIRYYSGIERGLLRDNTLLGWLRQVLFPPKNGRFRK